MVLEKIYDINLVMDIIIKLLKHYKNENFRAKTFRYAYLEDYNRAGFEKQIRYVELKILMQQEFADRLTDFGSIEELEREGKLFIVAERSDTDIEKAMIEKVSYQELAAVLKKYTSIWYNLDFYLNKREPKLVENPLVRDYRRKMLP